MSTPAGAPRGREIREGIKDAWPVAFGLIPLGLALGLLITQAGFAWWWAPVFSTVIYAGSMEFLALNMILSGVGPLSALVTGFMVNFRHIFYGLTFPRHLIRSRLGRAYSTYALIDEAYAIASVKTARSGTWLLTTQIMCQAIWVASSTAGAVTGRALPEDLEGLGFALTALFVVLAYEAFLASRDLSPVLLAGGFAVACAVFSPANVLMVALSAYFVLLLVRFWVPRVDSALRWEVR
ncbi:AzlC family ABC transporter permease [Corynebacterium timonense]|uniref:4-azaleucine resistance probable transporter AzlC n=1 Tax=Corynebacterium timonense TaxID=441500 RepID=A0A1H1UGA6_9CORY|nr:AzlC family ABC transporter permease [Corynebacterium timonense]SDS71542.1 4-azaleucine resistance probable transporter AzlC [Corynebacterium timonense]